MFIFTSISTSNSLFCDTHTSRAYTETLFFGDCLRAKKVRLCPGAYYITTSISILAFVVDIFSLQRSTSITVFIYLFYLFSFSR